MLVRKAASLSFKCFEIGPLWRFVRIDAKSLKSVLDHHGMKRSVHVGGRYDAEKLAATEEEYSKVQMEIHYGIELCRELCSPLVSFHPPFFTANGRRNKEVLSKARSRFLRLVNEEIEFASNNGIKMALESFCYPPFIFNGLHDFMQFISNFPSTKLGVLLEVGHLFQAGFPLEDAVHTFRHRLSDVHIHDATFGGDVRKTTHLPIGEGNINFQNLISALREVGYDGWLTLEIHGSERKLIESKKYLESLISHQRIISN